MSNSVYAFLFFLSLSMKSVFAETVLYCSEEFSTGFIKRETGWDIAKFKPERFTVKVKGDWDAIELSDDYFTCTGKMEYKGFWPIICNSTNVYSSYSFNFDKYSLRFVKTMVSIGGYARPLDSGEPDTDGMMAGTCEKF